MKNKIQKIGNFLSSMVMPNIAAFIAWGLITAFFFKNGWIPNKEIAALIDPMIKYLLPLLIAYSGGKIVYDQRGAVTATIATMGVIVGTQIPMFLGAMIVGPLAAIIIKRIDKTYANKIKPGFEMLVNNYSAGIIGMILAIISLFVFGPAVESISNFFGTIVGYTVEKNIIFLASIIVEPAKVLFLNNAINHGVFTPLGLQEATETGKSILFLIETNPGPGLGVLLAYSLFGKGSSKQTAPGAIIIHFFGGIHEIYFPYVLMKPALIGSLILGGMSGVLTFSLMDAGLTAAASPGSIFAILAMAAPNTHLGVISGIVVATIVSFAVSSLILKISPITADFEEAKQESKKLKAEAKNELNSKIQKIIVACDAGMGSSAMGATILKNKLSESNLKIEVLNSAVDNLGMHNPDLVITQVTFIERAQKAAPNAQIKTLNNFLDPVFYDKLVEELKVNYNA